MEYTFNFVIVMSVYSLSLSVSVYTGSVWGKTEGVCLQRKHNFTRTQTNTNTLLYIILRAWYRMSMKSFAIQIFIVALISCWLHGVHTILLMDGQFLSFIDTGAFNTTLIDVVNCPLKYWHDLHVIVRPSTT